MNYSPMSGNSNIWDQSPNLIKELKILHKFYKTKQGHIYRWFCQYDNKANVSYDTLRNCLYHIDSINNQIYYNLIYGDLVKKTDSILQYYLRQKYVNFNNFFPSPLSEEDKFSFISLENGYIMSLYLFMHYCIKNNPRDHTEFNLALRKRIDAVNQCVLSLTGSDVYLFIANFSLPLPKLNPLEPVQPPALSNTLKQIQAIRDQAIRDLRILFSKDISPYKTIKYLWQIELDSLMIGGAPDPEGKLVLSLNFAVFSNDDLSLKTKCKNCIGDIINKLVQGNKLDFVVFEKRDFMEKSALKTYLIAPSYLAMSAIQKSSMHKSNNNLSDPIQRYKFFGTGSIRGTDNGKQRKGNTQQKQLY